jgi:hypothetical protein
MNKESEYLIEYRIKALRDMEVMSSQNGSLKVEEGDIYDGQFELETEDGCLCFWINDPDQGFGEDFADYVYFPYCSVNIKELRVIG